MRVERLEPAFVVILSGVVAALHVGKIPPAIPVLSQSLGLTLIEAGFLLSMVQLAGMVGGAFVGVAADSVGLRRSIIIGQAILAIASFLGIWAQRPVELLVLRALEGLGFLMVVLPTPSLIRQQVNLGQLSLYLGLWGAYMPTGTSLALFSGPLVMGLLGWQAWWGIMAAGSAAMAICLYRLIPAPSVAKALPPSPGKPVLASWWGSLKATLTSAGPWRVAIAFSMYSSQWLAVIGFLPSIYAQAGLAGPAAGALTAIASLVNVTGNIAAGRLLHRGIGARRLLNLGFISLSVAAFIAFSHVTADQPILRYFAVLGFSALGGFIPGTLFSLAVHVAPNERCVSTTVGWIQQCSATGQFFGPPLVAMLASVAGGWQWTWAVTMLASLVGVLLARGVDYRKA